uniref:RNase H type-1 domain-containing protein n=1 Tax=Hordeum vulgare subsp. vulgare TaxID=112509 RepID=A0A8I7BDG1_HORVV
MVLRRENGLLIFVAYMYIFNCNDAFEAEIHALMQGMALALQHSDMSVIVQSDSSNALATIEGDAWSSRTNACTAVWLNSSPPFCEDLLSQDCNPSCLE